MVEVGSAVKAGVCNWREYMVEKQQQAKAMLAKKIVEECKVGMTIGLGAGSTVLKVVDALKDRSHVKMNIVVASLSTQAHCHRHGIDADLMRAVSHIDLYIDGADEVDPTFCCIKGRGGAMTGEMLCAEMAEDFVVLVDGSKMVRSLGEKWPVLAVEVVPWARSSVGRAMVKLGARPELRSEKSDMGNDIIDCLGVSFAQPYALADKVSQMTGVVGHGLFVHKRPSRVLVSDGQSVWEADRKA